MKSALADRPQVGYWQSRVEDNSDSELAALRDFLGENVKFDEKDTILVVRIPGGLK